jgi:hypothetical protein
MRNHFGLIGLVAILLLVVADAQAYRAEATVTVIACSPTAGDSDGGNNQVLAAANSATGGDCGNGQSAIAQGAGSGDIALGVVAATAEGAGPEGTHRATSVGSFDDRLVIQAPAEVNQVEIAITVQFTASTTGSFPLSQDLLVGSVSVPPNEVDIRLCNPDLCPDDAIADVFVSEVFVAQRGALNGQFSDIFVQMLAKADVIQGVAGFAGSVTVTVNDDSGAILVSDSGVFGNGAADTDGDGQPDNNDNCIAHANADQRDSDMDGYGNRCDADFDDNCIVNTVDLGLFRLAYFTTDADADLDGDGIVNAVDLGILKSLFFAPPGPSSSTSSCGSAR